MAAPDTFTIAFGNRDRILISWALAIVAEGYTRAQLDNGDFARDAKEVIDELLRTPPFDDPALQRLMVVALVSVESERPGSDIELRNPVPATSPFRTAFGAMFGRDFEAGKQIERILHGDSQLVRDKVAQFAELAPIENFLVVVNNTDTDGGSMHDGVGWFSKARKTWPKVAIHELGHQAFSLADEYPYHNSSDDPVKRLAGTPPAEPDEPNVTLNTDVTTIKWAGLVTLPQTLVPGTVSSATCVRAKPLKPTDPEIALNAVGAFEGAKYHDCGIFRPSRRCKMRDSTDPFCPVCENAIRAKIGGYMLNGVKPLAVSKVGTWTHAVPFDMPFSPATLFYNVAGNYALSDNFRVFAELDRRPDGSPLLVGREPERGVGDLGAGWSTLVTFELGGVPHVLGHDFGAGRLSIWRLGGKADTLVQTFFDTPGGTRSHFVALRIGGLPHVLSYDMFSGEAMLSRIDSNASAPVDVAAMSLGIGHTALVALDIGFEPFVLTYRAISGEVQVRKMSATGFVTTFASPLFFWPSNITHVAPLAKDGLPYIVRHASGTGRTMIHHVDREGGGVRFVTNVLPSPGPGALSFLGVGAPVLGLLRTRSNAHPDLPDESLYLYRALTQEIVDYAL
jgi:hypothetical protein